MRFQGSRKLSICRLLIPNGNGRNYKIAAADEPNCGLHRAPHIPWPLPWRFTLTGYTTVQIFFRFLIGGLIVSTFAALGDALKPKSFAGLFGAAPSVALATLGMTILSNGKFYAALEARSMAGGAVALGAYACVVCWLLAKRNWHAATASIAMIPLWFACALAAWLAFLR